MGSRHQSMADSLGRINPEIDVDASPMSSAGWGSLSSCWDEGGKAGMKVESPTSSTNPKDEGFRYKYRWLPTRSWHSVPPVKYGDISTTAMDISFSILFEFYFIFSLYFEALLYYLYRSFHAYVIRASKRQRHCWVYFIQYTHQQLCRYVVNTTQIYTVHSSAALQLDCVFSLSVNPLHFTGYEPWCLDNKETVSSSLHPLISRDPATQFRRFYTRLKGLR